MENTGDVMVSMLALSEVDHGFESQIGICCFSAKQTTLRRKSKYWLARNQDNVFEWCDMPIGRLLFQ